MAESCPHCDQALNLNDGQRTKLQNALAKLPEGKILKMGCPHCQQPIEFRADGSIVEDVDIVASSTPKAAKVGGRLPTPPPPPDLEWLQSGQYSTEEIIEDVPKALVLIGTAQSQTPVASALNEAGYQVILASSDSNAIEKMRFEKYNIVILHCSKNTLRSSVLHTHMNEMAMSKRRDILYVLLGPDYSTLYDLEALSCSANVVVNENEADKFGLIIKKAKQDYEALFGPIIETIQRNKM